MIRDLAMHAPIDAATTTTKATLFSLVTMILSWDANYQVMGFVSLNVLLGAIIGALLGIGYGDPIVPRRRLLFVAIVNSVLATAIVAILPHVPGMGWLNKASAAALAVIVGFAFRWVVPAAIEKGPAVGRALMDRYLPASKNKGGDA